MLTRLHRDDLSAVVVDDDDSTRALLQRLLLNMGAVSVEIASNGADGLRLVCHKRPSFVICDLEMEPVDGLSLLGGVRAAMDPMLAETPVFIFTGNQDAAILAKAKALRAAGYLIKPFNPKGFSSFLAEALAVRIKGASEWDDVPSLVRG